MSELTQAQIAGRWGEDCARLFLAGKGLKILGTRVRLDRRNEIDIIARDEDQIVFVEVKTRKSEAFGRPLSSVKRAKRAAICRAAVRYLRTKRFPEVDFRFDVVEVIGDPDGGDPRIRHITKALDLDRKYILP